MKNMYEVKPDESVVSGNPEEVVDLKYCPYPQSRQSPRWHPKETTQETTKQSGNKLNQSKSESPWTLQPKDMSRGKEGDKKFYALRPYGDLPDQTFLSPTRGDLKVIPGREGYYDNPNFVMSPKQHRYRHEEEHSSNTSHSRPENHKSKSKRHCFGATVIFLLVLLVIIAIGISVYFLNEQMIDNGTMPSRPPPSKLDSESLTADPDFGATIRVTNYDWDSRMADKESDVFRQTANDMETQLDNIFSKGPIAPLYNYSVIHSISEGSLVLNFTVHLKKSSSDASEEEKAQLEEQKLNLKKTPDIVKQAIKEGLEKIKKEQEQIGVTSSLPLLNIDANDIQVAAVTTTTITPPTSTASTTTPTTTVSTTTPTTSASTPTPTTTASTTTPTTTASTTTPTTTASTTTPTTTASTTTPTTTASTTTQTTTSSTNIATQITDSTTTATTPASTTASTKDSTTIPTQTTDSTRTATTNPTTSPIASTPTTTPVPATGSTTTTTTNQTTPHIATPVPATGSTTTTTTNPTTLPNASTPTTTPVPATGSTTTTTTNPTTLPIASTPTTTPVPATGSTKTTTTNPTTSPYASTPTTTPTQTTDSTTTATTNQTTPPIALTHTTTPALATDSTTTTNLTISTVAMTSTTSRTTNTDTTSPPASTSTSASNTTTATTQVTAPYPLCPNIELWKEMIIMVCNSSIKASNEASAREDQCYHFSQAVKCSTWLAHTMKYNCSMQDMRLMYNATVDWISVTTYDCLGTDMDIIEPFPASNDCDDLNALKYIINYECDGNDIDNKTCRTLFDAPECVTRNLNGLQLNCSQDKVTTLLNQHQDSLFNRVAVKTCEEKMAPLINGSCYGMSTRYFIEVLPCFQPLRELKDETSSLNTTCRMYLEGTRCLERKASDNETCSASHISRVLMGQMEYVQSRGENGIPFLLYVYGSAEKIRRVEKCHEHMESLETMVDICDDEEYMSDTIFSNLCVHQTKQGQNQCSITPSDLLQCTFRTVQQMDPNCTDTRIEQAVMGKINETNSNSTVCDNEEYCSSVLIKNDDVLVCLRFLSFINYTDVTVDDTCQFFGEGLECMSYFLSYMGVSCQPETLQVPTANFLLHNNYSEFDFNVCRDNLTLEVVPSTRPLCDNSDALLKYTVSTCIQPVLNDASTMPDPPCSLLTHVSYCVTKTLYESVLYCSPVDVATVLIDYADFVQAKYPSLNFTGCSVPVFNVSMETTTHSIANSTCRWGDITERISQSCQGELMEMNRTQVDGKCEKLYQLFGCIQSSLESRDISCSITLVEDIFKDYGDEIMLRIGINPRSCSDGEPINKTCSAVTQQMINPNAPESVMKCFSLVFTSLSGDIPYDDACRLQAMAMTCAIEKSNMLGYNCTTEIIGPVVKSFTSVIFSVLNFDPDNCSAPIETRSICEAGDLMSIIAASSPCTYYANLNDQPTCQSLSMLVECVSMRISTSGMFCSKSIILDHLVDNINMFEFNSTFNFTSCLDKDVIVIPPLTNLSSCSVVPAADISPLDTCQASIKEFHAAVNESVKCRILFDVIRCVASSKYYMGFNCTINDIIRLYGSFVLQGFNPENCDIPSEDDVPREGNLCTDGGVFKYFINYDCKEYFPDKHSLGFCGSLGGMSDCLGGVLEMCPKYEIENMIQAQPFMMYIGSIDDCEGKITTTPSPHFKSTTPYDQGNTTSICVWQSVLDTANTICKDQMLELSNNDSEKCPKLFQLFGCIQASLESRDISCSITLVEDMFKDYGDEVMLRIGINPRSCSDGEPINKTCSAVTQQMINPNAPESVMKCFSLVFTSLSGDIPYDDACRLQAMAMTCAIEKSNMLGYNCTTETIGPVVKSFTSVIFSVLNFDPDNCSAPIETRSICEAGDLMSIIAVSSPCTFYANLNDQPTCQSLSMLVECVSMRISTSGMFCSKSIILDHLVDNINMFELNSTFNFTSCLDTDVIVIPPLTNLSSCSVVPAADISPLDTCQASIKEFRAAVNESVKCRILFDVIRCVASSKYYMGFNCTINDIIRLYGSFVLQGFNPENCDIPSEDDVPREGNLCTDGGVFKYFINYDCKEYFPDKHSLGFCGSLRGMSNCLGGVLEMCSKYEIEKMIQAQPFMMYIGSIDDCEDEITTTPSPHFMSTTPHDQGNTTSICVWQSILDTANTICKNQMLELAKNDSEKCPKLTSLAQCIHIAMVARDMGCTMDTFLQLTNQNAGYMRQTFNIEVQACLDDNQLLSPPLYVVDRESFCSSSVVYEYVSKVTCMNSVRDCNLVEYMDCLTNNVMILTNSKCSVENYSQYLVVDTHVQTYFSMCSNDTTGMFNNGCINPVSNTDMTAITPCLSPIILMQDRPSCGLYAQSLKCMSTKLGMNCTIQLIHQYIQTVFNLVGRNGGNTTQMSVIPLIAEQCNDFVSNLTVDTIPDICQDSDQIINLVKRLPCIPQSASNVSIPCLYLVPAIKQCVQLASNMTGCKGDDLIHIVSTNTEKLSDLLPNEVLKKCLSNGTFIEYCPAIFSSNTQQTKRVTSCLTLSITARMFPNPGHNEDVCRLDSVAVKCVKEKGRMVGYDCDTDSIKPLLESLPDFSNRSLSSSCTIDEIEGSICDESDVMVILATSYRCSITYYNIQGESNCSILDKMTNCVSQRLMESLMYCNTSKIREGLVLQADRLQTYFNQTGQSTLNFSSCVSATKEISYDPVNMTECSEMLESGFDPVSMCQHSLMRLNQTQDTERQCRVFEDSMKCLVYASQFSGYNCTADDITEMYNNNNTMLSILYETLSQSCSGPLEIPRLTSSNMCNIPFIYEYIIRYICSKFIPGNSDRTPCSAILDLGSCVTYTLSTEFQTMCPSYLIEGHLQHQPFMTYIGSVSSCRNASSDNLRSGCDEVSVNSWHFTECAQNYNMINLEPEKSCLHWERTIQCVQTNVYNDGKYRYCKTKDVLASLVNGIELAKILHNFDPEPCNQEMYASLPDDPCDEMMLYSLAMNKCDPKNSICGQVASIKECVKMELMSHTSSCEDRIDEKLRYLISRDNQECSEGQYSIDDRNRVYIFKNQTTFICGLDWDDTDAEVLCQQLGYSYGVGKSDTEYQDLSGFTYNCTGNESRLEDCPQYYNRDCFFQSIVAKVFCYNDDTKYGLIDGQSANAGRVTVERNGVKGYLCSGYYDTAEVNSVCRKLGFAAGDYLDDDQILTKSLDKSWQNTISCPVPGIDFAGCVWKAWDVNPLPENEFNYCYKSMAVYCHKKTRLNTAYRNNTGMLMMYVEREGELQQTPVCKDNITQDLVTAQCQYLGFNDGGELLDVNPFVSTFSYYFVKINSCPPTANSIENCDVEYVHTCTQGPAILHCFINQTMYSDGDMKIDRSGRIWVYKYDLWGTICSKGWNYQAVKTVCRSQGYDSSASLEIDGLIYNAIDTKWLYNVSCLGNETGGLLNCSYSTSDDENECRYADDAGAFCYNRSDNPYFHIRDGVPPNAVSFPSYGRLYFSINGEEGALCAPKNTLLPQVICKQHGFTYGEYLEGGLPPPSTPISWRADLRCKQGDTMVLMCFENEVNWIRVNSSSPSEISCDGDSTVQFYCYKEAWLNTGFFNITGMITMLDETEQPIVLCENQINREGLEVFCKYTRKSNTAQKIDYMQFPGYHATGSIGYNCSGGEVSLSRCQRNTNVHCEGRPVVVRCDDEYDSGSLRDMTMDRNSGRLKILKYGVYGSMCADQWTDVEADVFCRSKGYIKGYAKILIANRRVAQFHAFKCYGSETSLLDCTHLNTPTKSCDDAAVKCITEADNFTLSLEHQNEYEGYGRILVSRSGVTSYFCDTEYLSSSDAVHICRHLGFAESEILDVDNREQVASAWEVNFECNSNNVSLYGCINGEWKYESWSASDYNPSNCRYNIPQIRCSKPVNRPKLPDLKTRCENYTIYEMVDKDCYDVIDNITLEVRTSQMSACQYLPELVQCFTANLISQNIYCTESQVYSTLRQNQPEITSIIGGLNTDECDGMTYAPKADCASLPLFSQLLPQCYDIPNTTITDFTQIAKLCGQGIAVFDCLVERYREVGYLCKSDDFMNLMAQNQQYMTEKLRFNVSFCIQDQPQQTTQGTVTTTVSSDVNTRCLNSSIYDMVDKDCDDVIDNITVEVQSSQMSACQYFPELVQCLSENLISRNIICSEIQVFSTLRQSQPEITAIIGGLNTDNCDGMTFVPKDACTSLPLYTQILSKCYDVPNSMVIDPIQINLLCTRGYEIAQCLLRDIVDLGYTGCTVDVILGSIMQNPQWARNELKLDINQCQQPPN